MSTKQSTNIFESLREGVALMGDALKASSRAEQFFAELVTKATLISNSQPAEIEKEIAETWAKSVGAVPTGLGVLIRTFGQFALLNNDSKFTSYYDAFKVITKCDSTKVADVLAKFKTQKSAYNAFVHLTKPAKAQVVLTPAEESIALQKKALETIKSSTAVMNSIQAEVLGDRLTEDGLKYLFEIINLAKQAHLLYSKVKADLTPA
jgi:hypothetical protein